VEDDALELMGDYYESPAYQEVLLRAADDDSLHALVHTALQNQVRARLRPTQRGRLARRVIEILRDEGYVIGPKEFWRRRDGPPDVVGFREADLLRAAWRVQVRIVRWRPEAKRNSPAAERSSIVALIDAILDEAGGPVHQNVLVEVIAARLGIGPVSYTESLDLPEESTASVGGADDPAAAVLAAEAELDAAVLAVEVWGQLSPQERKAVPHLADSARAAAAALEMGKTKANQIQARLLAKLRVILGEVDPELRSAVLSELLNLLGADRS
jgi:hypothetical protein